MRSVALVVLSLTTLGLSVPALSTIVGIAPSADFSISPYTIGLFDGSTYTFSAIPLNGSDTRYRTAALATTGSATAYGGGFIGGGTDYTSYSAGSATPGNNFGGDFITALTARPIDYSLTDTYVALRFGNGASIYYGYAEVAGDTLLRLAYNDVAGGSITTGQAIAAAPPPASVPEPATWAMFIGGFGLIGTAVRRKKVAVTFA